MTGQVLCIYRMRRIVLRPSQAAKGALYLIRMNNGGRSRPPRVDYCNPSHCKILPYPKLSKVSLNIKHGILKKNALFFLMLLRWDINYDRAGGEMARRTVPKGATRGGQHIVVYKVPRVNPESRFFTR